MVKRKLDSLSSKDSNCTCDPSPKYEILYSKSYTNIYHSREMYRIKALRDFADVKAGDIGGFVSHERNLAHYGDCWIYGNGAVFDSATLQDDAIVSDNARVGAFAQVGDNARIYENASVLEVKVGGNVRIYGGTRVQGYLTIKGNIRLYRAVKIGSMEDIHDGHN